MTAALLSVLALAGSHVYHVTDLNQRDRSSYELTFREALRRGHVYAGVAHDNITDSDIRVRFKLTRTGRIADFRGPAADTTQPAFPIRAAFYYAWYPEAWWRDPVFPYSLYHPSLDYYSAADARVVRDHTDAFL